ncbi:MAG: preprotein translocase subunit YajC [Elusimicrobiota bacterium]|jgi:preprotein translocase subunit YajC|nr:preprotein translocase subunit YajC [Elusimicrobiota bacterium]
MNNLTSLFLTVLAVLGLPSFAFAQNSSSGAGSLGGLLPLLLLFVFFYIFLLRPQQKKAKEHQKQLNALKKDDKIITGGGLFAVVISVNESVVEAKIADNVKVQISKPSISAVISKESENVAKIAEIVK